VPVSTEATEALAKRITFIRETHYGKKRMPKNGLADHTSLLLLRGHELTIFVDSFGFTITKTLGGFWDFTSDLGHGDTAYTDIPLGAHTDTTYFTDPAGYSNACLLL
jgi:trimethyllysine dioxygenase